MECIKVRKRPKIGISHTLRRGKIIGKFVVIIATKVSRIAQDIVNGFVVFVS